MYKGWVFHCVIDWLFMFFDIKRGKILHYGRQLSKGYSEALNLLQLQLIGFGCIFIVKSVPNNAMLKFGIMDLFNIWKVGNNCNQNLKVSYLMSTII